MSAPPDYYVLAELRAAAASLSIDNPTNAALVRLILDGATDATIDRVWADLLAHPPTVIMGHGHEKPPEPPLWVVLLKSDVPEEIIAGGHFLSAPEPFELEGQRYGTVGGPMRQTIQVQAYAENPETVRFYYIFLSSLMYKVAWQLIMAQKINNAYPVTGGDYMPATRLIPAGVPMRFLDWIMAYEMTGFVPIYSPPTGVDVEFGPEP